MKHLIYILALRIANATSPSRREKGKWGVLLRMRGGGFVTYSGMDELSARVLVEAYNVGHDARVEGSRLILP